MFLLFCHVIIVAICLVAKVIGISESLMGLFFVISSSLATFIYIVTSKDINKELKMIILIGFVMRIILVCIDVFVTRLPDAGTDDDGFYSTSLNIYNSDYSNALEITRGGIFPKLLALVYFLIGSSRLSAQYLNVLLYAVSSFVFIRSMINFGVTKKYLKIGTLIFCLMPNAILFNSILRRETIMELCLCSSIFFLSKWYINRVPIFSLLTIVFIALASLFHTAFIFGALIFVVYFALYDKQKRAVSFSINKFSKMLILLVCAIILGVGFLSLWKNKLTSVSDMDDIYFTTNRASGGSVYLENYKVNNFGQLIIFTPLKLFYFLFSPVPWKFRNAMDVISFILDALVYIVLIVKVLKLPKESLSKLLFVTFVFMSVIFALGTFNSGTAIRHRFSLLPYLLISYTIARTREQETLKSDGSKKAINEFKESI